MSLSAAIEEIQARLRAADGWPDSIGYNRDRLSVWGEAVNGSNGLVIANLFEARPVVLAEAVGAIDVSVEYTQPLNLDYLVTNEDDVARFEMIDRALASLFPALCPVVGAGELRDINLGGRCGAVTVTGADPEGVIIDSTAFVSGVRIGLSLLMEGEVPGGEYAPDGLSHEA